MHSLLLPLMPLSSVLSSPNSSTVHLSQECCWAWASVLAAGCDESWFTHPEYHPLDVGVAAALRSIDRLRETRGEYGWCPAGGDLGYQCQSLCFVKNMHRKYNTEESR